MQPKAKETKDLESTFNVLAEKWVKETAFHSNDYFIVNHPAYEQIVALGEAALPLIFRELEKGKTAVHWPLVLSAVTGAEPTPPPGPMSSIGWVVPHASGWFTLDIRAIHEAWLRWGREKGYQL